MSQVRNLSVHPLWVPDLNAVVQPDEVIDATDPAVFAGLISQPDTWGDVSGSGDPAQAQQSQAPTADPAPAAPPTPPADQPDDTTTPQENS